MMRAFVAFVAAVALIGSAAAQDLTSGSANAPELVVARTMVTAKIVPTPKPEPVAPVAAVKKAPVPAPSKVAAKAAKKDVKKPKLPPGAASAAAKAALPKAPKDELIKWIRATLPGEPTEAELHKIHLYLNGQLLHTFEDLIKLGEDGIKALIVSDKLRALFLDKLIAYIGKTRGVDDGLLVPTAPLRKAVHKKKCTKHAEEPRFMSIAVNPKSPKPLADWLRRAFPDTKPLRMSRTLLALERQTIKSFDDLQRIGVKGVAKLLYVPDGIRGALRDAIIHNIGVTGGHDDGKPVTARHYVPPKPVHHDDCE